MVTRFLEGGSLSQVLLPSVQIHNTKKVPRERRASEGQHGYSYLCTRGHGLHRVYIVRLADAETTAAPCGIIGDNRHFNQWIRLIGPDVNSRPLRLDPRLNWPAPSIFLFPLGVMTADKLTLKGAEILPPPHRLQPSIQFDSLHFPTQTLRVHHKPTTFSPLPLLSVRASPHTLSKARLSSRIPWVFGSSQRAIRWPRRPACESGSNCKPQRHQLLPSPSHPRPVPFRHFIALGSLCAGPDTASLFSQFQR